MQIHELNSYTGTPGASDYLAIDDGTETTKVPATDLGVTTQMTQAEAEAGAVTESRVVAPSIFKTAVTAIASAITGVFVSITNPKYTLDTSAPSGDDYDLTQALTSLGWLSDVVTSGVLGVKKLLFKMLLQLPTVETINFPGTYTIGSSGYVQLGQLKASVYVTSAVISTWGSNTGAFSLILSGNVAYLAGTPNVKVANPTVRFTWIPIL